MRPFLPLAALLLLALLPGCSGPAPAAAPLDDGPTLHDTGSRAPGLPPPAALVVAEPGGPLVADPLQEGPLATLLLDYDFGVMMADAPNAVPPQYPVAIRGEVTVPDGTGPYPVLLFMHGRHGTCDIAGFELLGAYACPDAGIVTPVDSHQGYRPVAQLLASHGYVVASIDANDINERDQAPVSIQGQDYGARARGQLALRTLDLLAEAHATGAAGTPEQSLPDLQGRLDLERVGLMGHSRGGEGMARAVLLNGESAAPRPIQALFALAPTDFAWWQPTGVAFATLLPYCDGDVSSLHGSWMYDDLRDANGAGPLHQVLALGANHNFYNDRWTGDDWGNRDDPWCDLDGGKGRDAAPLQMTQGAAVVSSFFRQHVGGEAGFAAYWTGEVPFPDDACAADCSKRLLVSRHAPVGHRLDISAAGEGATATGPVEAEACAVLGTADRCRAGSVGHAERLNVTWAGPGELAYAIPQTREGFDVLVFRIAVHAAEDATLTVRLPGSGVSHAVPSHLLEPAPGDLAKKLVLNQVRVPLPAGPGTGTQVVLAFTGSGEVQLADIALQRER